MLWVANGTEENSKEELELVLRLVKEYGASLS